MSRVTLSQGNAKKPTSMKLGVFQAPPPYQETEQNFIAERQLENVSIPPPSEKEKAWKDEMDHMKGLWKEVLDEKLISADEKITEMERTIRDMEKEKKTSELQVVAMKDDLLFQSKSKKALLNRDKSWREQLGLIEGLWKQRLEETVNDHRQRCEMLQNDVKELQYQLGHVRKEWIEQETDWNNKEVLWANERTALEERLNSKNRKRTSFWKKVFFWRSRKATRTAGPKPSAEAEKAVPKPAVAKFKKFFKRTGPWGPIKRRKQRFVSSVGKRIKSPKDPISKEVNFRISRVKQSPLH